MAREANGANLLLHGALTAVWIRRAEGVKSRTIPMWAKVLVPLLGYHIHDQDGRNSALRAYAFLLTMIATA